MPLVQRTPLARSDLLDIWLHIADDNVDAADRFVDLLDAKTSLVATQPMMRVARPDLGHDVRSFTVDDYLLFYLPINDGIELLRVIHGSRDIPAIFQKPS